MSYVSFGGDDGNRTHVYDPLSNAFYMFILLLIFITPKWTSTPNDNYTLLNSLYYPRVVNNIIYPTMLSEGL